MDLVHYWYRSNDEEELMIFCLGNFGFTFASINVVAFLSVFSMLQIVSVEYLIYDAKKLGFVFSQLSHKH